MGGGRRVKTNRGPVKGTDRGEAGSLTGAAGGGGEIGRASEPVAAAALVAGTGWIGAREGGRRQWAAAGGGWGGCVASRAGSDRIAGNVADWSTAFAPSSEEEGREAVGAGIFSEQREKAVELTGGNARRK
jgi:hypothetical protein